MSRAITDMTELERVLFRLSHPGEHGTCTRYRWGCRCRACKDANAAYMRWYRAMRRAGRLPL